MGKQWHGGKGDEPRNINYNKYSKGWDTIFGKEKVKARKAQPKHSITQIHKDKTKSHPRMYKYKGIQEDEVWV